MALASCSSSSRVFLVRSSWDTQQRLPYNPNPPPPPPRPPPKLKQLDFFSLLPPSFSTSPRKKENPPPINKIDVDKLLKFNPTIPCKDLGTKNDTVNLEEPTYLGYERWLPSAPKVKKPRSSHNAAALAYIGDCIYELYARRHFLAPALNIEEYNDRVMAVVRCEAQDALLQKLSNGKFLTEDERDVLRWGKNITSAKTRTTRRAGVAVYNRASSLETLIGYLYLTNPTRLEDMMSKLGFSVGFSNQSILEVVNMELQNLKQKSPSKKKPLLSQSKSSLPSSADAKEALV